MECPKCGYVRQPGDTAPDYECPSCGIIYAKFKAKEVQKKIDEPSAQESPREKQPARANPQDLICRSCGTLGGGEVKRKGSGGIELLLYLIAIVPGIIYSLWRSSNKQIACAQCGGKEIIAIGSPVGQKLMREIHPGIVVTEEAEKRVTRHSQAIRPVFQVMGLIVFIVAIGAGLSGQLSGDGPKSGGVSGVNEVTYVVKDVYEASVTYQNEQGGSQQESVYGPWTKTFNAQPGQFLYVSAQNGSKYGGVTVLILVNGTEFRRSEAIGGYKIATANGRCCR